MRKFMVLLIMVVLFVAGCGKNEKISPPDGSGVAVSGMVTLADIGSLHCKPCLLMMPILASLEKDYQDRAAVKFIDVNKYPGIGRRLQIMTIPTQIIYDRQGKEVLRHIGFFPEPELRAALDAALSGKTVTEPR